MVELIDPRQALVEAREARQEPSARQVAGLGGGAPGASQGRPGVPLDSLSEDELWAAICVDFRVLLTIIWRYLLNCDPSPDQLSMAYHAQHGPTRDILEAFRGFSKSWIIGAFAIWLLCVDHQFKVLVASGSQKRSTATTNWCFQLIQTMPILRRLRPKPSQRQSAVAFDVGPARPDQSPSFHAAGIGGQIVGFRADFILGDDVETQTNSLTVTMREKIKEAVKEFDSILKPGGTIKFLGTPHDHDSLYLELEKRGYSCHVWPAYFPTPLQLKGYGGRLHPYITSRLRKDPSLAGTPVQPGRFTPADLEARALSLGKSEFALQFMLDTSLSDKDKYPLKFKDLIVMDLDLRKGPESVTWGTSNRITDLPLLGFSGDYYHSPMFISDRFAPWSTKTAFVDPSGRGKDETGMSVVAELYGHVALLFNAGWVDGAGPETLRAIAKVCVQFDVEVLQVEDNFGDGMFTSLLRPIVIAEWKIAEDLAKKGLSPLEFKVKRFGTRLEEVKSTNQMAKEKRILSLLEPVTQQHRLIVAREVIEADERSLQRIEGEDTRRAYSLFYQFAHLTRDKDSLKHDDRLESLAGALVRYAAVLGVDPGVMAGRAGAERVEEELKKLLGEADELGGLTGNGAASGRMRALSPSKR